MRHPLPEYYSDYLKEKNHKVNGIMDRIDRCAAFVFFADLHISSNSMMSPGIIESILDNTSVRDVVCGGDVINSYGVEETALEWCRVYNESYSFAHPYFVRGNHDVYIKESETVHEGYYAPQTLVYNRFFRKHNADVVIENGKTYYYFDRPEIGVRFIAVDTNEIMDYCPVGDNYFEVSVKVSQTQVDWLADCLRSTPAGYKILMAGHRPVDPALAWYAEDANIFWQMIEAFNNKCALRTESHGLTADCDFSGTNGKILLYISGHGHTDDVHTSESGCVHYEVNDDAYIDNGGSKFKRIPGTLSESALDVVIVDVDSEEISCVRYGAGEDKILGCR